MKQPLPSELIALKKSVLSSLQVLLTGMFDKADDWLFEKANGSSEHTAQQEYLDAMRLIRLQRTTVENNYFKYLSDQFSALVSGESQGHENEISMDDLQLALVGHEEMEQSVALDSMAARVRSDSDIQLRTLEARIQALLGSSVNAANNPLDPSHLCHALRYAIKDAGWEIKYQLIFFKLFQLHVLKPYSEIVYAANKQLCDAGVLQGLNDIEVLQGSTPAKSNGQSMGALADPREQVAQVDASSSLQDKAVSQLGVGKESLGIKDFSSVVAGALGSLAQSIVSQSFGSEAGYPSSSAVVIGSPMSDAKPLALTELLSSIHQLQYTQSQSINPLSAPDLVAQLSQIVQQAEPERGPQRVREIDSNVINFVSMLFDFVLGDELLPQRVKAVISRLQIPYLKVAVSDADFLSSDQHVARKLVNTLARAGLGLTEEPEGESDAVFEEIQRVVQTILDEFSDDVQIIEDLAASFTCFMERENKRAELVSKRVAALEEGKHRNELAKREVAETLHAMLSEKAMPSAMAALIEQPWQSYLCWIHHKQGKDSPEWVKAFYVVQQMLFCLEPVVAQEESDDRQAVIEEVFCHLERGCETIGFNQHQLNQWLSDLEVIFQANATYIEPERLESIPKENTEVNEFERLSEELDADLAAIGLNEPDGGAGADAQEHAEPDVSNSEVAERHQAAIDDQMQRLRAPRIPLQSSEKKVTLLDIAKPLTESKKAVDAADKQLPALSEDDPGMQKASNLPVGSWLQYESPSEPGKILKCKLAAHIKSVDKLIFVNRSGAKLFEKMRLEVAHDINGGRLQLLDDSQLFDRALESVISSLRDVREKAV